MAPGCSTEKVDGVTTCSRGLSPPPLSTPSPRSRLSAAMARRLTAPRQAETTKGSSRGLVSRLRFQTRPTLLFCDITCPN